MAMVRHILVSAVLFISAVATAQPELPKEWKPARPYSARMGNAKDPDEWLKNGGSLESQRAVVKGLGWLVHVQAEDGQWEYDGTNKADTVGATALVLLPILGAGETHKRDNKYGEALARGLKWLIAQQQNNGSFKGPVSMESHALATLALCEAYSLTKDRNLLLRPAHAAIHFLIHYQNAHGGWGEKPDAPSCTSAMGWTTQALFAARLEKDFVVPDKTIRNLDAYLDSVASGSRRCYFGDQDAKGKPATLPTAIGLLSRCCFNSWDVKTHALAEGAETLIGRRPSVAPAKPEWPYHHYATRVLFHYGYEEAWQDWNEGLKKDGKRTGGMRDWLVSLQEKIEKPTYGSWEPGMDEFGKANGRLGTTAMSVLTLEVYYRHPRPAVK